MEVIIGAVAALIILAGIHRAPQEHNILPKRGWAHSKKGNPLGTARKVGPKRTAAYWWFRESAQNVH